MANILVAGFAQAPAITTENPTPRLLTGANSAVTHPLDYVGITSNLIWVPNLDAARQSASQIADLGANTVRIFEPYNPGQAYLGYDRPRFCNAVEAAQEYNLTPEISNIGFRNGAHDYVSSDAHSVTQYLTFMNNALQNSAGPNANHATPDLPACVQKPVNKILWEPFNEVGSRDFNSNTDSAQKYAYLIMRTARALQIDVNSINQARMEQANGAPVTLLKVVMVVGGLAIGNHDAVGFLRDFDADLKAMGAKNAPFDMLAIHPYPTDLTVNPASVLTGIYEPLKQELDSAWGKDNVPMLVDEVGVNAIPSTRRNLYGGRSLQAVSVSEAQQATYYHDVIEEAASKAGVSGILLFQSRDVRNDGWPSGELDPQGNRKASFTIVKQAFEDALSGNFP